jgi:hypothetical protein
MKNGRAIFIPLLILVYFFVHYATDLWYFLNPAKVLLLVSKYCVITAGLFFTGYLFIKDKFRYILAFSTLLFLFLFFGSITDTAVLLGVVTPLTHVGFKVLLLFAASYVLITVVCFKMNKAIVINCLKFWLIYCFALIIFDVSAFCFTKNNEKNYMSSSKKIKSMGAAEKPSVFFLLFDMYPSDTVLHQYLQSDNKVLETFLKENNFFVTGNARSLYTETYYSLASSLNLQPLGYFGDSSVKDYKKKLLALKNIEHSLLPGIFTSSGYEFRNYSVFNIDNQASPLWFNLNYHLDNALTASTFFNRSYDTFEADFFLASRNIDLGFLKRSWSSNVKRDLGFLRSNFTTLLANYSISNKPSFNYFHFMMPHPPVLYDSSGHELSVKDMYAYNGFDKTNRNFTGYIKYANDQLKNMIKQIFEKAGENVVIIVQGDHGYREFNNKFPYAVRYGVLNSVYLPSKNYNGFNDSITVLQTLKLVMKNQFNYAVLE